MTGFSRRQVLASAGATGAVALAGCGSGSAENDPTADVIHSGDDTGCLDGVEVVGHNRMLTVEEVDLQVTLIDGHGYGKIVAEWQEPDGDQGRAMRTVTPDQDSYELELDAVGDYVHLTVGCDAESEVEVIADIADEDGESDD